LPDATVVIDRDGKVISWNQAIEAMTGVKAEDILGKGNYEHAIPFYGTRRPILIDLVLKSEEEFERNYSDNYSNIERKSGNLVGEAYIPNLKGEEAYIFGTAAALYDSKGEIVGAIESIRDITERKRAGEALSKAHSQLELKVKERTSELEIRNAEMERFVYTVSHDLRTPLISISGFMGFLKQDFEKGDVECMKADLRIVNEAVAKMDSLLQDTLELSRIGRIVNPSEDILFGEIVKDALDLVAVKIHEKNVEILEGRDWPAVLVDKMRISEVLVNLIENSLKYMGGQLNPEIELGHRLDGKETVFFVRDNGIGIDPGQYDKVFGLFYKVDKESKGTGVGLAIVKGIIEVHGGRIWIESEIGKGCTMCFTLPLARAGS
jgi:signal transduction histidine kinase